MAQTIKTKICFVTAGRSDYSILNPLLSLFLKNKKFKVSVIASGNHFDKDFGNRSNDIKINTKNLYKIKYSFKNHDILKISSKIINESSKILNKLDPDFILIIGDRYEIFAITFSAYYNSIPIIHLHGGETSLGSLDNYARDSISKLASIHFVSNIYSKNKLIRLNEDVKNISIVGSLGVEHLINNSPVNKKVLEKKFNFSFNNKNILVSYHPNTISTISTIDEITNILESLKEILKIFKNLSILFTAPNADLNYKMIINKIKDFCNDSQNAYYIPNFGMDYYPSTLKNVDCIVGNSSSGIIESHSAKTFALNIGERQKGRYQNLSTKNCDFDKASITNNLIKILKYKNKQKIFIKKNIYEKSNTSIKIINKINSINKKNIIYKNKLVL